MTVVFREDLSSNCVEMDCYEERLVVGLPGRHEATKTKSPVSILSIFAVDTTATGYVLSLLKKEGHWK